MGKCEHIIGFNYLYEASDIITLNDLKNYIKSKRREYEHFYISSYYTLSDYCDNPDSTDITCFNYCPMCGEKIDWKAIKGSEQKWN